jgi:hypothetical protein
VSLVPRADAKTVKGGRLRTTASVVPDAPIGHFSLRVFGGKQGYLVNTRNLCERPPVVEVGFVAQNGKRLTRSVKTSTRCGKAKRRAKRAH